MTCVADLKREIVSLRGELGKRADNGGWMDAKRAADYLGMSSGTFDKYRYKMEPRICGHTVGGKTFYKREDLDMWVKLWEVKSAGLA